MAWSKEKRTSGPKARLQQQFVADVLDAWEANGPEALQRILLEDPSTFVRVVASLVPKEIELNINQNDALSTEQLKEQCMLAIDEAVKLGLITVNTSPTALIPSDQPQPITDNAHSDPTPS